MDPVKTSEKMRKIEKFFSSREEKKLAYDYLELFSLLYFSSRNPIALLNVLMFLFACFFLCFLGSPLFESFFGVFLSFSLFLSLSFNLWFFCQVSKEKVAQSIMWRRKSSFLGEKVFQDLLNLFPDLFQIIKKSELEIFF